MKNFREIIKVTGFLLFTVIISNCDKFGRTGVCTGFSSEYNSTYCKDGWTEDECDEWNDMGVNGVTWYFHPGQTCEERGTPAN